MKHIIVTGGRGEVGRAAVALLRSLDYRVTVVGRSPGGLEADYRQCDIFDAQALADVCCGADLVLNAAGPSSLIGARVAQAALLAGADYVDVAGDPPLWREIAQDGRLQHALAQRACVLGAGLTPGLAAMLPRYALARLAHVSHITLYGGGIERFTAVSAADFIASLNPYQEQGRAGKVIADGEMQRASAQQRVKIPTAARPFDALPFLSFELEQLAGEFGLGNLAAYSLVADAQMLLACQQQDEAQAELVRLSTELAAAEGEQQHFWLQARGTQAGQPVNLELRLRFANSYRLTGSVAALAANALLRQPAGGLKWLPQVLTAEPLLNALHARGLLAQFTSSVLPAEQPQFTEGEL